MARYKSSLTKVFNDEALAPSKLPQRYTSLDVLDPKNNKPRAYDSHEAHNILNHQRPPEMFFNDIRRSSQGHQKSPNNLISHT